MTSRGPRVLASSHDPNHQKLFSGRTRDPAPFLPGHRYTMDLQTDRPTDRRRLFSSHLHTPRTPFSKDHHDQHPRTRSSSLRRDL